MKADIEFTKRDMQEALMRYAEDVTGLQAQKAYVGQHCGIVTFVSDKDTKRIKKA